MIFLKSKDLSLQKGGYLLGNKKPVYHPEFVKAQEKAHYLILLADKVSKADFSFKTPDSFETLVKLTVAEIKDSSHVYLEKGEEPVNELGAKLTQEALNWLDYKKEDALIDRVNSKMQEFNILKEFEEFGLYFTEKVTKLAKLYTTEKIVEALKVLDKHLK